MQSGDTKRREPRISPIEGRATMVALNPGARSDRIIVGDRGTRQQKRPSHLVFEKNDVALFRISCIYLVLGENAFLCNIQE